MPRHLSHKHGLKSDEGATVNLNKLANAKLLRMSSMYTSELAILLFMASIIGLSTSTVVAPNATIVRTPLA